MVEFDVDPATLFAERSGQFVRWGIPADVVARARARITDMWGDGPDSWTPVWATEALAAQDRDDSLAAALCWGAARFPCLATPARRDAYARQLTAYHRAGVADRWEFDVPYRGETTAVPAHVLRAGRSRALLVICGGVDTWKVELHRMATNAAGQLDLPVAVVDMPGTGESAVPLAPDADALLAGVTRLLADRLGAVRTAFFGVSFGGHWAAKLALRGEVDAAVDLGGPIGADGPTVDLTTLPGGMGGIVGHALHLDALPGPAESIHFAHEFSLRQQGQLDRPLPVPLLAVNGADDPYLPATDTTVFTPDPHATTWLLPDAGHCAGHELPALLPSLFAWIHERLLP